MRQQRQPDGTFWLFVILGILLVLVIAVCVIFQPQATGNGKKPTIQTEDESEYPEKWQEGVVSYNGKNYIYDHNIKTYLFMGIDKDEPVETAEDYNSGGQSDAMFLLVCNKEEKTLSVISINRNTMTRVLTCYANGLETGYTESQICVQHGFGDGKKLSCSRTVDAVSYLFYNQPINGYMSMNVGAVPMMNDGVGGITLTVLNDIELKSKDVSLKEGETVTLSGDEAYAYLRSRDVGEFDSATLRLRRQEQYITAYLDKLKALTISNPMLVMNVYEDIAPYVVSDMSVADVVTELMGYEYSPDRMYTVPGETVAGDKFEEFHVDDEALYDLIIRVFYKEVTE